MKVHFITSRISLEKDIDALDDIIGIIKKEGHSLARDWVGKAYEKITQPKLPPDNWKLVYKENLETIAQADVVIAETSYENFGVGYQVATAVLHKKPVLLLRHSGADKNAFVTGVEDGWVLHKEYDDTNLETIIKQFLDDNDIKSKDMRFNFFIDRKIYNYLKWASHRTSKTKAEILRELVVKEIEKQEEAL